VRMKTLGILLLLTTTFFTAGCDINLAFPLGESASQNAGEIGDIAAGSFDALEQISGKDIITSERAVELLEEVDRFDTPLAAARVILKAGETVVPENYLLYVKLAAALVALGGTAQEVSRRVLKKQNKKSADDLEASDAVTQYAVESLVLAGEISPGAGKKVISIAEEAGIAPLVQAEYERLNKMGLAGKSATSPST